MVLDVLSHRLFRCSGPSLASYVTSFCVSLRGCCAVWLGRRASTLSRRLTTLNLTQWRFYLSRIWELPVLDTTIHQAGAQWTLFSRWLARIRFSEPLQQQHTKHAAAAAAVVVRRKQARRAVR
ncbi:hypothetical protein ABVT39_014631 [Epinephelus coioides]